MSRWETSRSRPTADVLRRYEELLDLRPALLTSIADAILRYSTSRLGSPVLERVVTVEGEALHDRVDGLLDRVISGGETRAGDWDELSHLLITRPQVFLPRATWTAISETLLSEVLVADGVAYFQRFEALNRLMAHPRGQAAAIAACTSIARDRDNEVFIEPITLLDATRHRDANKHITSQLGAPTNRRALVGALLASVRKVRDSHFDEAEARALFDLLVQHVCDAEPNVWARTLAGEVLRIMPDAAKRHSSLLHRALREDEVVNEVMRTGWMAKAATMSARVRRIRARAVSTLPGDTPAEEIERPLGILVDEMLHSPVSDVRMLAAQSIAASPFKTGVADALVAELGMTGALRSRAITVSLLGVLTFLAGVEHRWVVERLAVTGPLPSEVASAAVTALAHMPGQASSAYWRQALARHLATWQRSPGELAGHTLRGLVYCLGIARRDDLLVAVEADSRYPQAVRSACRWWVKLPRSVRAGASL